MAQGPANEAREPSTIAGNRTLVVIGASYAASWPIQLVGSYTVVNRGVPGDTTAAMLARFDRDALAADVDTVLLWGHINDIFRADVASMEQTLAIIERNIAEMHRRATSRGIDVIVATEVTIAQPKGLMNTLAGVVGRLLGKTSYQSYVNGHVMEMNGRLRRFAESNDLGILDFERLLADDDGMRRGEYAIDDGSHLSEAAYEVLSAYTTRELTRPE
jgi:lysophospholipase L1-like esterase